MTKALQDYFDRQLYAAADLRIAASSDAAKEAADAAADAAENLVAEMLDAAERAAGDPSLLSALHYSLLNKYGEPPPVAEEICTYSADGAAADSGVMVCQNHWRSLSKDGVQDTCGHCGEVRSTHKLV
jgi:hypothetical protein